MKKIYIAGPITGREKDAETQFLQTADQLSDAFPDAQIINPMALPHKHDKSWLSYMQECIPHLMKATHIYLLPGWQESKGTTLEVLIAINTGITLVDSHLGVLEVKDPKFTFQPSTK